MKRTSLEERKAYCQQYGHSWIGSYPRHCSWCWEHERLNPLAQADKDFEQSLNVPPSPYLIEQEPTIGTPEEAQAVAMSLWDADIERLEEEEKKR